MKRALPAAALLFGLLSVPSFLGWSLLCFITTVSGKAWAVRSLADALGLAGFFAGWYGWASLFWVAANFERLGVITSPRWVKPGFMAGILVVLSLWATSFPIRNLTAATPVVLLFFGGAPLVFVVLALIQYTAARRRHARTHA
jgi:hypothetical protein